MVANGFVTDDAAAALPREKEERYLSTYHHRRRRRVVGPSSGRHVSIMLWICSDSGDVVAHSIVKFGANPTSFRPLLPAARAAVLAAFLADHVCLSTPPHGIVFFLNVIFFFLAD